MINNKLDKLTGPAGVFAGVCLLIAGIITAFFEPLGLFLAIPGMFVAFTYDGALIDIEKRRIKNYTKLFGILRAGKWHEIDEFTMFSIRKSKRRYTTYSRANVPLDIMEEDIRLILSTSDKLNRITVSRHKSFEAARKEMSNLINELGLRGMREWI